MKKNKMKKRRKTMGTLMKTINKGLVLSLTLMIVATSLGVANAGKVLQIKPKDNNKLKIGVIDLVSSIEVAALTNKLYIKEAKARGWDCHVYDLKPTFPTSNPVRSRNPLLLLNLLGIKLSGLPLSCIER